MVSIGRQTATTAGDPGIMQMIMDFLTRPGSPIGQVLNPGANPGFGIASGSGGPGLPPPNPAGAISGGGPPGATPDPSQVVQSPLDLLTAGFHDPHSLTSNAMAGLPDRLPGGPAAAGGPAMGNSEDIANAIRAMTAAGGDQEGVPADAETSESSEALVNPARAGAGGAAGRLPRPGGQYKTQKIRKGDTLSGISQRVFGDASRYKELQGANSGITDPNKIQAGGDINVPVHGRVVGVTRAKGSPSMGSGKKQAKKSGGSSIKKNAYKAAQSQAGHDRLRSKPPINLYGGRH